MSLFIPDSKMLIRYKTETSTLIVVTETIGTVSFNSVYV